MGYNMRLCCWLVLTAALTVGFCLGGALYVEGGASKLGGQVAQAVAAVEGEDWPRGELVIEQGAPQWEQTRRIWLGLMNHQDVYNIDLAFANAGVYAAETQKADTLAALSQLGYWLRTAVESDRLCWHNLF